MFDVQQRPLQQQEQQKKSEPNLTGIPTQMKLQFEEKSGLSFDDVQVHYNSDKPAKLGALAYTQGTQVHVGPGQERHLGHELGHVVQQKLGMVRPNISINGTMINYDNRLERQADNLPHSVLLKSTNSQNNMMPVIQMAKWIWRGFCWEMYEASEPSTPMPMCPGLKIGQIVDTSVVPYNRDPYVRVVFAAGDRANEAARSRDHPHRLLITSDIQTEEEAKQYAEYLNSQKQLLEQGNLDLHEVDATTDATPSLVTSVPFLETGNRDRQRGPLTSDVMKGIFTCQNQCQQPGHILEIDIYTGANKYYRLGQRYGLPKAATGTSYRPIKRLPIHRRLTHAKTKDHTEGTGLAMEQEERRRIVFERQHEDDGTSNSQMESLLREMLTDDEDASDFEDAMVESMLMDGHQPITFKEWYKQVEKFTIPYLQQQGYTDAETLTDISDAPFMQEYERGISPFEFFQKFFFDGKWL